MAWADFFTAEAELIVSMRSYNKFVGFVDLVVICANVSSVVDLKEREEHRYSAGVSPVQACEITSSWLFQ